MKLSFSIPYLNKKYKLVESDNYDAYLKKNKVKLLFRKLENFVKQTVRLTEKDGKYAFETTWPMLANSISFRPGIPFDEIRIDGVVVRSIIEFKDNKMVHLQKDKDMDTSFVREYSDKYIKMTVTCEDVVCHRNYARITEK